MEMPDGVIGGFIVGRLIRRLVIAGRTLARMEPPPWTPPVTAVMCKACGARLTTAYRYCGHCGARMNGAR